MAHVHYREEHPLPAMLMHWAHLLSMVVLIITGFFIHQPFAAWPMWLMRQLHFWAMYLLIIVLVLRIYWAIFGAGSSMHGSKRRVRDGRWFVMEKANKGMLFQTAKYYLFLRKTHPATSKFNPLQKITYVTWALLIVAQAITGFAIYTPTAPYLAGLTYAIGGQSQMRVIHYLVMWLFIVTSMIHIYLAAVEDITSLGSMFFGRETSPKDRGAKAET